MTNDKLLIGVFTIFSLIETWGMGTTILCDSELSVKQNLLYYSLMTQIITTYYIQQECIGIFIWITIFLHNVYRKI